MMNIKNLVNRIADRAKSTDEEPADNSSEAEGFICPTCHSDFPSPDDLQMHYEDCHMEKEISSIREGDKSTQRSKRSSTASNMSDVEMLKQEVAELQLNLKEEKWHSEELHREVSKLKQGGVPEDDNECALLRTRLDRMEQRAGEIAAENVGLKASLDDMSAEKAALEERLKILEVTLAHKDSIDDAAVLRQEIVQVQKAMDAMALEREDEARQLTTQLTELREQFDLVQAERSSLEDEVLRLNSLTKEAEEKFNEQLSNKEAELHSEKAHAKKLSAENNNLISQLGQNSDGNEALSILIQQLQQEKAAITEKVLKLEASERSMTTQIKTNEEALKLSKVDIEKSRNDCSILATKLAEIQASEKKLVAQLRSNEDKLKQQSNEQDKFQAQNADLIAKFTDTQTEKAALVTEIESLKKALKQDQERLQQIQAKMDSNNKISDEEKSKLNSMITEKTAAEKRFVEQISSLQSGKLQLEKDAQELRKKLETLNTESIAAAKSVSEASDALATSRGEAENLRHQIDILTASEASLQEATGEAVSRAEIAEKNVHDLQQECKLLREQYEEQLTTLTGAKEILLAEKIRLEKELDHIGEETAKKEAVLATRINDEKSKCAEIMLEKEKLSAELKKAVEQHRQTQSELNEQISRQEIKISALRDEHAKVKKQADSSSSTMENLRKENDELAGIKLELEAKVENAAEERRSLMERCLGHESECEQLRSTTLELRRKLEDCQSALHELGRENQTLQMESAKLQGRKWAADDDVPSCTTCAKEFTMTIRRHHCRNCGQIFCNECSSKTACMPSSKKGVRVCDACYDELTKK